MKQPNIRIEVAVPVAPYRKLKTKAAAEGCSANKIILAALRSALQKEKSQAVARVRFPLIRSEGEKVRLTNEQIYHVVEFPLMQTCS